MGTDQRGIGGTYVEGIDVERGAVAGGLSFLVGYVLTGGLYLIEASDGIGDASGESTGELGVTTVDLVGWLFYNAHFVDVGTSVFGLSIWVNLLTGELGGTLGAWAQQFGTGEFGESSAFTGVADLVPLAVWLLVPVVVLLAVGYVLARRDDATDPRDGARAGASQAVGYFLLAVVGTFLFSATFDVGPQLEASAAVMGLLYPIVFGGAGGAVAGKLGS